MKLSENDRDTLEELRRQRAGLTCEALSLIELDERDQPPGAMAILALSLLRQLCDLEDVLEGLEARERHAFSSWRQDGGAPDANAAEGGEASGGPGGCNPHAEEAHRAGPEASASCEVPR